MNKWIGLSATFLVVLLLAGYFLVYDEGKVTVRVPVLEGNKEEALQHIEALDEMIGISAKYMPFDVRMDSHPDVSGYLEITGSDKLNNNNISSYDRLIAYVNGMKTMKVYPVDSYYWKRTGNEFKMLEIYFRRNEENGVREQYIVLTPNELKLYFSNK